MYMAGQFLQNTGRWGKKVEPECQHRNLCFDSKTLFFMYSTWYISVDFTLGLKLCVGRMCSCWARGVPQGWYSLKHSLQKLDLQSAQPLLASRAWGGLQNWHMTAMLPRLTVCLYLHTWTKKDISHLVCIRNQQHQANLKSKHVWLGLHVCMLV